MVLAVDQQLKLLVTMQLRLIMLTAAEKV